MGEAVTGRTAIFPCKSSRIHLQEGEIKETQMGDACIIVQHIH